MAQTRQAKRKAANTANTTTKRRRQQRNRLAQHVAHDALMTLLASRALATHRRRAAPKGLGGTRALFVTNANGTYASDPVSLDRIPTTRALKIGKHWFDAKTIAKLFNMPAPRNPLTRQPLANTIARNKRVRRFRRSTTVFRMLESGRTINPDRMQDVWNILFEDELPDEDNTVNNEDLHDNKYVALLGTFGPTDPVRRTWNAAINLAYKLTQQRRRVSDDYVRRLSERFGVDITHRSRNANGYSYDVSVATTRARLTYNLNAVTRAVGRVHVMSSALYRGYWHRVHTISLRA